MSADEIRRLARVCDTFADMACDNASDPEGAVELYENMQQALLDYAAMVERCEESLKCNFVAQDGRTTINSAVKARVNYILKGAKDV